MADFFLVFFITFIVIAGVTIALIFGKAPLYQPDGDEVMTLLTRLIEQQLPDQEWHLFIGVPIPYDPEIEQIRLRCQQIAELYSMTPKDNKVRLTQSGIIAVKHILNKLEQSGRRTF